MRLPPPSREDFELNTHHACKFLVPDNLNFPVIPIEVMYEMYRTIDQYSGLKVDPGQKQPKTRPQTDRAMLGLFAVAPCQVRRHLKHHHSEIKPSERLKIAETVLR